MAAENEIRLRPSQEKFSSRLEELNVIRVSHYQVGFLNRQFIMIMSALGLPDDLFMELFENEVKSIRGLTDRVREKRPSEKDIVYLGIYTSVSGATPSELIQSSPSTYSSRVDSTRTRLS